MTVAERPITQVYPRITVSMKQASGTFWIINKGGVKVSVRTANNEQLVIDRSTVDSVNPEQQYNNLFYGNSDRVLFTTTVGDIAAKDVVTVRDDATIREAAMQMSKHRISSLVVVDKAQLPVGIMTDRDLREKVVARGRPVTDGVKDIMSLPLVRVDVRDYCFEAMLKMMKHNVHHILAIKDGQLKGVLTNHDIMLLQGTSLLSFTRDLESQEGIDGLVPVSLKINRVVYFLLQEGAKASNITKIITELNDLLVRKVLGIAEKKFGRPPLPYCWIALGSEGRKEQAFKTDQENAIIYAAPAMTGQKEAAQKYFGDFAPFVRDSLTKCGFNPCSSDYTSGNPDWRRSLPEWKRCFVQWFTPEDAESLAKALILFDFRFVYGESSLAKGLRDHLMETVKGQNGFLGKLAATTMKSKPALGFFKRFRVEREGIHKNQLSLNIRGIGPLADTMRILAMWTGVPETSTLERIEAMKGKHPIIGSLGEELCQAFEYVMTLLIRHQLEQVGQGLIPDHFIRPDALSKLERRLLKGAFQVMARTQASLSDMVTAR